MDPNAALLELLKLTADYQEFDTFDSMARMETDVTRMCELISALDGWLSRGGFLPARWERK